MTEKKTVESTLARIWLVKVLGRARVSALVLCYACLAFAVWLKFTGGLTGPITSIAGFGASMGLFSYLLGKYVDNTRSQIERVMAEIAEIEGRKKASRNSVGVSGKVPLTIGFANLAGDSETAYLQEDIKQFSYIFQNVASPPAHSIPKAEVLFVYAKLDENGAISPEGKSGIRQIVQLTNAAIVVVATQNSPESIKKAIGLPGPKSANIVFTISRNGKEFGTFFRALFEKMRNGKEMLSAWVELAPQAPGGAPTCGPATLLAAEGGKIAFPRVAGAPGPVGTGA